MKKHHFSPAEVTGIIAIGLVVLAAWLYSVQLTYSFFVEVAPGNNPSFPYLGLAFTDIGFALWGIGFICAKKPFTQVISMIMGLASGGAAFTVAATQFIAMGDAHYNIAADPANYTKALLVVVVMFLANLITLALKAIVWRFSQHGTGFFQPYDPETQYLPVISQQPQYQVGEARPKEERSFEQRATVRQLPPAQQRTGFWKNLVNKFNAEQVQQSPAQDDDDDHPDVYEQPVKQRPPATVESLSNDMQRQIHRTNALQVRAMELLKARGMSEDEIETEMAKFYEDQDAKK